MAKNINMTDSVFRRQIRNVVHEALLSLIKENDGPRPGIAPIDPKDLMDEDEPQAKTPIAKVDPKDLTDDGDDSDFGYPAEPEAKPASRLGPVAQKFQDRLDSARAEKARAMRAAREKPENSWVPGERDAKGKLIDPKEAFVEEELKATKGKKMNADQLELAKAQAEAKYDKMMLVKAMAGEEEGEEAAEIPGTPDKKEGNAHEGYDARLQDIADKYYDGGVETARMAIQRAMDKMAFSTPPKPDAGLNANDTDPSPKDEFGPEYGMSNDDMTEAMWDAFDNYLTDLEAGGMSRAEVKEFARMVGNDPMILVDPNPYLDDEQGRERVGAALKAGKIDQATAQLMYRAIDELPAGESFEPNALRRSGLFDVDEIKDILRAGTMVGLKTGQPIKNDKGQPIKWPIQQDDRFVDEEFKDFRWHLRKVLDDHMSDKGFGPGDRKAIRAGQKEKREAEAAAAAAAKGQVYKKDGRGRPKKPQAPAV